MSNITLEDIFHLTLAVREVIDVALDEELCTRGS